MLRSTPLIILLVPLLITAAIGCGRPEGPPNILLLSLDTFRADRLGALDDRGVSLTPNLDALAADGRRYTRAFSHSNETLFAHAALLTGRLPSSYGALDYRTWRLPVDAQTLPALLSRAGWRTEAVVAGGHLSPSLGVLVGFQRVVSMTDFGSLQQTVPVAAERLRVLSEADRPFLLLVHGYDTHSPYIKPGPLFRQEQPGYEGQMLHAARNPLTWERVRGDRYHPTFRPPQILTRPGRAFLDPEMFRDLDAHAEVHRGVPLTETDLRFLRGLYDSAVRYTDFWVGALMAELAAADLDDSTVIIAFGDHGEDLLDNGYFNHRLSLRDASVRVPLIVSGPDVPPAVIDAPVGLMDVFRTALGLAGLPADDDALTGADLLGPADPERVIIAESLRGEVLAADAEARLGMPRAAISRAAVLSAGVLSAAASRTGVARDEPPVGAWLVDDHGAPLPWEHPSRARLARALRDVSP